MYLVEEDTWGAGLERKGKRRGEKWCSGLFACAVRYEAADGHYHPIGSGLDDNFDHYRDPVIAAFHCDDCTAVTAFDYHHQQFNPNSHTGSDGAIYDQQLDSDDYPDRST